MKIWLMPALLALLSGVGLIAALVGDDLWDVLGWASLGVPVLVMGWCWLRPVRVGS